MENDWCHQGKVSKVCQFQHIIHQITALFMAILNFMSKFALVQQERKLLFQIQSTAISADSNILDFYSGRGWIYRKVFNSCRPQIVAALE